MAAAANIPRRLEKNSCVEEPEPPGKIGRQKKPGGVHPRRPVLRSAWTGEERLPALLAALLEQPTSGLTCLSVA